MCHVLCCVLCRAVLCCVQMTGFGAFILVIILLIIQFVAFIWVSGGLALNTTEAGFVWAIRKRPMHVVWATQ
jgi:hypothetical protein